MREIGAKPVNKQKRWGYFLLYMALLWGVVNIQQGYRYLQGPFAKYLILAGVMSLLAYFERRKHLSSMVAIFGIWYALMGIAPMIKLPSKALFYLGLLLVLIGAHEIYRLFFSKPLVSSEMPTENEMKGKRKTQLFIVFSIAYILSIAFWIYISYTRFVCFRNLSWRETVRIIFQVKK